MKENEIIIHDKSTVKRTYLQKAGIAKILPAVMIAVVIVCTVLWFFFARLTVSVKGYCESVETKSVFMLPMYYRSRIVPGDTIWLGNHSGKVESIAAETYITYDDILRSDDMFYRNFANSGNCNEGESYIQGIAVFPDDISGITEYRIVTDTITPCQMLTGGGKYGE